MSYKSLSQIVEEEEKLGIAKDLAIQKAFASNDVEQIFKAQNFLKSQEQEEKKGGIKSILVDPNDLTSSFGYKAKPYSISYDVLRAMSRTHVIKSIIETRKEQVSTFCYPQTDKYSTGFIIRKRISLLPSQKPKKLTKQEEKIIEKLTMFILDCGERDRVWHADTFDTFTRKFIQDSLSFDQGTFEVVRDLSNKPKEFLATDGATYRISDTYDDEEYKQRDGVRENDGYLPSYVQIIDGRPVKDFYPWELCLGVRNPTTDIRTNGYGRSELEDMIQTVTAILNADTYNANFFKVGSSPKGILRYSGNVNETTLQDFRRQWMGQTAGVMNMHKIPIINADKIDFIPTHVPNKDMEFSNFQEFLIKISCALFKIDPAEIGFPMQGSASAQPMFEGNNEARLKYSKDKGLKPLLKQYQYWLNKFIIWPLEPDYELVFVGIDGELTFEQELDNDIKMMSNFETINEIRKKRNLPPIKGMDIIANPIAFQSVMAAQQAGGGDDGGGEEGGGEEGEDNPFDQDDSDPFKKSLYKDLERILQSESN